MNSLVKEMIFTICEFMDYLELIHFSQTCKKFYNLLKESQIWNKYRLICDYDHKLYRCPNDFQYPKLYLGSSYEQFKIRNNIEFQTHISLLKFNDDSPHYYYQTFIRHYLSAEVVEELRIILQTPKTEIPIIENIRKHEYLSHLIEMEKKNPYRIRIILDGLSHLNLLENLENFKVAQKCLAQLKKRVLFDIYIKNTSESFINHIINKLKKQYLNINKNSINIEAFLTNISIHMFSKDLTLFIGHGKIIMTFTEPNKLIYSDMVICETICIDKITQEFDDLMQTISTKQKIDLHLLHGFIGGIINERKKEVTLFFIFKN
jgi:hypothetical protein